MRDDFEARLVMGFVIAFLAMGLLGLFVEAVTQ